MHHDASTRREFVNGLNPSYTDAENNCMNSFGELHATPVPREK
jgi:hypothetical protein